MVILQLYEFKDIQTTEAMPICILEVALKIFIIELKMGNDGFVELSIGSLVECLCCIINPIDPNVLYLFGWNYLEVYFYFIIWGKDLNGLFDVKG